MIYYGEETRRALENFDLGERPVRRELIDAVVLVKKAAALTYGRLEPGRAAVWNALVQVCDAVLAGEAADSFPLQALQGGAGTSLHMNVNEVLAALAPISSASSPTLRSPSLRMRSNLSRAGSDSTWKYCATCSIASGDKVWKAAADACAAAGAAAD